MYSIFINGRIPSKKNQKQIFKNKKTGRNFITDSKNHKEWHRTNIWTLKSSWSGQPLKKCHIELVFIFPDRRKADLTNKAESVLDLLVDAGIIEDDNFFVVQKVVLLSGGVDKENCGCKVLIDDLSECKESTIQREMDI